MNEVQVRCVGVSVDCDEPSALAAFYLELLGGELVWSSSGSACVRAPGLTLVCQRVEDYRPPRWPGASIVHLDLSAGPSADATAAAMERAVALGAVKADPQPDGAWVVLVDPAGHPFCITPHTPPPSALTG